MSDQTLMRERRVVFDFAIDFANGGGIQGQDFRLDIEGDVIPDQELAEYVVRDMRLLMVASVRILRKEIIAERHKRKNPTVNATATRLIELSHTIEDGMVTYKGMPGPVIGDFLTREDSRAHYAPGTEFHIASITMVANTGTYLDSPYHRFADAPDLASLPLQRVADLDSVVVRVPGVRAISAANFADVNVWGKAVLIETGWDRYWRTDAYFNDSPHLTADAASYLVRAGAVLVGIDTFNIDDTSDPTRPAHTHLLATGIPIVEHLCNLAALPARGLRFFAVPVKVRNMGSFPVRAFAIVQP